MHLWLIYTAWAAATLCAAKSPPPGLPVPSAVPAPRTNPRRPDVSLRYTKVLEMREADIPRPVRIKHRGRTRHFFWLGNCERMENECVLTTVRRIEPGSGGNLSVTLDTSGYRCQARHACGEDGHLCSRDVSTHLVDCTTPLSRIGS
ncbi:uncharacterized protein UV8b_07023 [Ustilaginoidea virens]|uniref:Secreted protein n=1 Tax=Ustilaginoidea virens TaxID=1159556 RepID=A0A8E5HWJ1_USTVR|nr:uncharacterized protein UV8b_07023 [Ustilaginoidea virens]QUC22782.1 hypothetical protein UV8b_07023 [Ustilaginoidea virens]